MNNLTDRSKAVADDIGKLIQASRISMTARACMVTTRDREQALEIVRESAGAQRVPLFHFTAAARRRFKEDTLSWEQLGDDGCDVGALLEIVRKQLGGGVFIVEDSVTVMRDETGDRVARARLAELLAARDLTAGLLIAFVEAPEAEARLPAILSDQVVKFSVPYPTARELEVIAREELSALAHQKSMPLSVEVIRSNAPMFASALAGYTRKAARDAVRDSAVTHLDSFPTAIQYLTQRKVERLSRELCMNVLGTDNVELPVGLDNLVHFLEVSKSRMRLWGKERARGVLLIGPPGTGKTMLARAFGKLVGLPVVEFQISRLMNSLLGETERSFARAYATLEALAPNVVFVDEIEKAFGDSSERDGGTMMRTTGSLLSWLSDNPAPNFIVATCNNLKRMGEIGLTMTRSERFDAAYFVDVPTLEARIEILARGLDKLLPDAQGIAQRMAQGTDRFSGADLYSMIKQARARAQHAEEQFSERHLRLEADRKRPRVQALYEEFANLRRWGRIYCEPASSDATTKTEEGQ